MIEAYELASKTFPYPLHLGVTEAGPAFSGSIKSAIGIGLLLHKGIGNTIRVSLTDTPEVEIKAAKEILKNFNLISNYPNLISCPTCGRIQYDMTSIIKELETYLDTVNKNITIAVMGCPVNGPGEAKHADIGVAGGKDYSLIFKKGKVVDKVNNKDIFKTLKKMIEEF